MKHHVTFLPTIVIPAGLSRQPACVHCGITIEQMTFTVVSFLNKIKCAYDLPKEYSNRLDLPLAVPKYVPECCIKPTDDFPMIVFSEGYKNLTRKHNQLDPAYIACVNYAPLGTSVTSTRDITVYLETIHEDVMLYSRLKFR
jgi:hypothetical protein